MLPRRASTYRGSVSLILKIVYVLLPAFNYFSMRFDGPSGPPGFGGAPISSSVAVTVMVQILFTLLYGAEYVICSILIRAVGKTRKDRYVMSGAMASLVMACIAMGVQILSVILSVALVSGGNVGRGTITVVMIMGILAAGVVASFGIIYMRVNLQARNAAA